MKHVYQVCVTDESMWEDGTDDLIDALMSGNPVFVSAKAAKTWCEKCSKEEHDELLADDPDLEPYEPLEWTKVKDGWYAESMGVRFAVVKTPVKS